MGGGARPFVQYASLLWAGHGLFPTTPRSKGSRLLYPRLAARDVGVRCLAFGRGDLPVDRCLFPRGPCIVLLEHGLAAVELGRAVGQADAGAGYGLQGTLLLGAGGDAGGPNEPFDPLLTLQDLQLTLIEADLASVGQVFALVGEALALVGDPFPLVGGGLPAFGRTFTSVEPPGTSLRGLRGRHILSAGGLLVTVRHRSSMLAEAKDCHRQRPGAPGHARHVWVAMSPGSMVRDSVIELSPTQSLSAACGEALGLG